MSDKEPYAGSDFQKSARGLAIGVAILGLVVGRADGIVLAFIILIAAKPAHSFVKMSEASEEKKRGAQVAAHEQRIADAAEAEAEETRQAQQSQMSEMRRSAALERTTQQVADSIQTIESAIRTLSPEKDNATMLTTISNELKALHRNSDLDVVFDSDPSLKDDLVIAQNAYVTCGVQDAFIESYFNRLIPSQDFIGVMSSNLNKESSS